MLKKKKKKKKKKSKVFNFLLGGKLKNKRNKNKTEMGNSV